MMLFCVYLLIRILGRLARLVRFSADLSPAGGLRLPAGKHTGILTEIQTKVNKKMTKKALFLKNPVVSAIVFGVGKFVQSISD